MQNYLEGIALYLSIKFQRKPFQWNYILHDFDWLPKIIYHIK